MTHIILRWKDLLKSVTKTSSCSDKISINGVSGDGKSLSALVLLVLGFLFSFVHLTKAEIFPAAL